MTKTIWKYELRPGLLGQIIEMPERCKIVHIAMQGNNPYMWVKVNTDNILKSRHFYILATGEPIPDGLIYCGTYFANAGLYAGAYVFHVFERLREISIASGVGRFMEETLPVEKENILKNSHE